LISLRWGVRGGRGGQGRGQGRGKTARTRSFPSLASLIPAKAGGKKKKEREGGGEERKLSISMVCFSVALDVFQLGPGREKRKNLRGKGMRG